MEVIGLCIDGSKPVNGSWNKDAKLHVFSRTRNVPYFFYYRYLALEKMNWYPWDKMQVDIPSYNVEDDNGVVTGNGCYITPVVWQNRLLIFFPQIAKKSKPNPNAGTSFSTLANSGTGMTDAKPVEYYE